MPSWTELETLARGDWAQRRIAVLDAASVLERLLTFAAASLIDRDSASSVRSAPADMSFRSLVEFLARRGTLSETTHTQLIWHWKARNSIAHDFTAPTCGEAASLVSRARVVANQLANLYPGIDIDSIGPSYSDLSAHFSQSSPRGRRGAAALHERVEELIAKLSPWTYSWHRRVNEALKDLNHLQSSASDRREGEVISGDIRRLVRAHDSQLWSYRYTWPEGRNSGSTSTVVPAVHRVHPCELRISSMQDLITWMAIDAVDSYIIPDLESPLSLHASRDTVVCSDLSYWIHDSSRWPRWGGAADAEEDEEEAVGLDSAQEAWKLLCHLLRCDDVAEPVDIDKAIHYLLHFTRRETEDGLVWIDATGARRLVGSVECIAQVDDDGDVFPADVRACSDLVYLLRETLADPPPFLGAEFKGLEARIREIAPVQLEWLSRPGHARLL